LHSFEKAHKHALKGEQTTAPDTRQNARVARIQADLSEQLIHAGRAGEAQALLLDSRRRLEDLLASDPLNTRHRQNLILTLNMSGLASQVSRQPREAVGNFQAATSLAVAMADAEPADQGARFVALQSQYWLGTSLLAAGSTESGIDNLRLAIAHGERLLQAAPAHDGARLEVGAARLELGEALLAAQRTQEGCREVAAGLAIWRELKQRGRLPGESAPSQPRFEAMLARCPGQ
jgi:hypothetical protein